MRLLLTTDAVGGVWQYATDLARALSGLGVDSTLLLLGPAPSEAQRAAVRALTGVRLVETGWPLDWLCDGPGPILAAGAELADLVRDERADLVQLNMPSLAAGAPLPLPTIAVTHGCLSSWWLGARPGEPFPEAFRWHYALTSEGLRAADQVVSPSAGYARTVTDLYGLSRLPAIVHNGRSLAFAPARAQHDCPLTVGRLWDRAKNAALLDRVAGRLAVPFHAAGAMVGPHGEQAAFDHLHPLGLLDEKGLAARLACRPVFVSAARFEPFGLAVLEAAAAGCALVLSDITVFRELWDGAALFVDGEDEAVWAARIEAVLRDDATRAQLGMAARARARRYTADAMARAMLRLYRRTLARNAGRVAA